MMVFVTVALSSATALAYFLLGPVVIPRLLRGSQRNVQLVARASLAAFFVGCALTHIAVAAHAIIDGVGDDAIYHMAFAVPQVAGGYMFILCSLLWPPQGEDV